MRSPPSVLALGCMACMSCNSLAGLGDLTFADGVGGSSTSGQSAGTGSGGGGTGGDATSSGSGVSEPLPSTDLTGDGIDDLSLFSPSGDGALYVFAGAPQFSATDPSQAVARIVGAPLCQLQTPFIIVEDSSGAQRDVIAGMTCGAVRSLVTINTPLAPGDTSTEDVTQRIVLPYTTLPQNLAIGDIDGDGLSDLIATFPDSAGSSGVAAGLVTVGDLNADGVDDFAARSDRAHRRTVASTCSSAPQRSLPAMPAPPQQPSSRHHWAACSSSAPPCSDADDPGHLPCPAVR